MPAEAPSTVDASQGSSAFERMEERIKQRQTRAVDSMGRGIGTASSNVKECFRQLFEVESVDTRKVVKAVLYTGGTAAVIAMTGVALH